MIAPGPAPHPFLDMGLAAAGTAVFFVLFGLLSRRFERQADIYGLEVTFGIIPPAAQTGTEALQTLGEADLAEPNPNPLIEFWLYDHPSISKRMAFVQRYDPWSRNETQYVH